MKRIIAIILIISSIFSLSSCLGWVEKIVLDNTESYSEKSNWSCTDEEFDATYSELYKEKIEELKQLYQIECEMYIERKILNNILSYNIYLYSDVFTIRFDLRNRSASGRLYAQLYYYETENSSLDDYEEQKPYVNFFNDFVNYAGYDTITDSNQFEVLYHSITSGTNSASNSYYYDSSIGNVGYVVTAKHDQGTSLYQLQGNEYDETILCNGFWWEGLLKPLK